MKDNNYPQFKDKLYKQVIGMSVGNPLSPTIANLVLDSLIEECFEQNYKPEFVIAKQNTLTIFFR